MYLKFYCYVVTYTFHCSVGRLSNEGEATNQPETATSSQNEEAGGSQLQIEDIVDQILRPREGRVIPNTNNEILQIPYF